MLVSVIIPVFNEQKTIIEILKKINKQKTFFRIEILVSDDGSTDSTSFLLKKNKSLFNYLYTSKKNFGKGHAIRMIINKTKGDIILIQDADLEYDPNDYKKLLIPLINNQTNCVYGSRVLSRKKYFNGKNFNEQFRILANFILTFISNLLNRQDLTDAHTCYKVIRAKIFRKINLHHNDFSFCSELNTKLSLLNERIIEVPIKYSGRTVYEGKKIRLKDAFIAIFTIIKFRFFIN
jgi:glycosyltransferase involved in cell wall biosynthesis